MDGERFDDLARILALGVSRRQILKLLAGGTAAIVSAATRWRDVSAKALASVQTGVTPSVTMNQTATPYGPVNSPANVFQGTCAAFLDRINFLGVQCPNNSYEPTLAGCTIANWHLQLDEANAQLYSVRPDPTTQSAFCIDFEVLATLTASPQFD